MSSRPPTPSARKTPTYFVTGYPGFIAKRLVEQIARKAPKSRIYLLVQPTSAKDAQREANKLPGVPRIEIFLGDVGDLHLGLSGAEYGKLCAEVTDVFHLAALSSLSMARQTAWRVNVDGTRNVLELARECPLLRRFNHFSTCFVSGERLGVIAEDELETGQGFHNVYEETKFEAEKAVQRAAANLPVTVFRPSIVIGDSRGGEIDRFDGPYYVGVLRVMSPLMLPLPLPGSGDAPLNVVPVDYVVEAAWALSRDAKAEGKTFHLVDPHPMSARRVHQQVAEKANQKPSRLHLPARAAEVVFKLPFLERWAGPQRAALQAVNHLAFYTSRNAVRLLESTSVRCPPLESYLDKLVNFVREHERRRRELATDVEDPLDSPG